MKQILLAGIVLSMMFSCSVMKERSVGKAAVVNAVEKKDSSIKKIKPYNEIITKNAITKSGLFKVHNVDEKWFFEIPDSLLGRDILIVNRISKAPSMMGLGGDQIAEWVVQFEKGPAEKFFIRRRSFILRSDDSSNNSMKKSVDNSNLSSIVAAFTIKARTNDSSASVIDMTDALNGDFELFAFNNKMRNTTLGYALEGYLADRSYISNIQACPMNVEIKTIKTYSRKHYVYTFELNSSLVLLPKNVMRTRFMDSRVGYFSNGFLEFNSEKPVEIKWMANRWRLEPKPEDLEKYKRGELVLPAKQIVYYIDPATPKVWVPYLIQGVQDWQKAFEKAGFKNAIIAKEVSKEDSTWSLEDARHSVIVYKASDEANASGPQINDPRSGEILESHINWYHNVQELIHDWYMIQAGPNDPRAQKMHFDDELMGRLIRYVCSHEVGHTLGLKHNFVSSSLVPTDSLRSKHYIRAKGYCPSIMDYARFNYVAQPEDQMEPEDIMPRIGEYDEWAIEWGYKYFDNPGTINEETEMLENWVSNQLSKNKMLRFGEETQTYRNLDPGRQSEDLGNDAVKAGVYGIKNLKRIYPQLEKWTKTPTGDLSNIRRMVNSVWMQYFRYLGHVTTIVGGVKCEEKYNMDKGPGLTYPSREAQQNSVKFLNEELFKTPAWLVNNDIYLRIGSDPMNVQLPGFMHFFNAVQRSILGQLVSHAVTNNMITASIALKDSAYTPDELFTDLEKNIWSELNDHSAIDIYRRNLQRLYIERLIELVSGYNGTSHYLDKPVYPVVTITDAYPIINEHLRELQRKINSALPKYQDRISKLHLIELKNRIRQTLDKNIQASSSTEGQSPKAGNAFEGIFPDLKLFLEDDFKMTGNRNCWRIDAWLKQKSF